MPPLSVQVTAFKCKNRQKDSMKDIVIHIDGELNAKLQIYYEYLLAENEKYNLTAITDRDEVWNKHFADSISGAVAIPQNARVCDIGCGAGFPSVPLKFARDDIDITLVDSLAKRVEFCKTLCAKLGISATFVHCRAEDFAKTHSQTYDVAVARAVAPLNILLEYTAQIVKIGGMIVAYKTDLSEVPAAENAARVLGLQLDTHYDFSLADGSKRALLVYRKTAPTPSKYPRGQNKPRKNPL